MWCKQQSNDLKEQIEGLRQLHIPYIQTADKSDDDEIAHGCVGPEVVTAANG